MLSFVKKLGKIKITIIALASISIFVGLIFTVLIWNNIEMEVLYKDLSLSDRSLIINKLNSLGINYEINENEILINSDLLRKTRMLLAAEGLPSDGSIIGYEIFNKSEALGTSSFAQNVNLLRALEGELSRTIMSFDNIQNARVHLVIPKKELFHKTVNRPKASVILRLYHNTLASKQVTAIAYLVSSAVQGLEIQDITIVSTDGKPFKVPEDGQNSALGFSLQDYKLATEQRLQNSIENLIGKFVGEGGVKAEVNVELDLEQLSVDSENFDPEGQVLRSMQTTEENSSNSDVSGSVSVANNIPNSGSSTGDIANRESFEKKEEVANYEISREVIKKVKEPGGIKRLSIAVLVDGNYSYNEAKGKYLYEPHPPEILDKLYSLTASAVGFNVDRGDMLEVINMQFSHEDHIVDHIFIPDDEKYNYSDGKTITLMAVIILALAFVAIIARLFYAKKTEKATLSTTQKEILESEAPAAPSEVSIFKQLNNIISSNPEEAILMLRSWMEEKNGH